MLAFEKLGVVKRPVRSNTSVGLFSAYDGNVIGGMMVGTGMALSGACPGTVLVQLAQGISPATSTAVGAVLGAGVYVRFAHLIKEESPSQGQGPKATSPDKTISDVSHIPEAVVYPLLGAAIFGILYLTNAKEGAFPTTPVAGGLLIGLAQAASLLVTSTPLGVSTAYEHISRYILRALGNEKAGKLSWPPKPIIFSLGIVASSALLVNQGFPTHVRGADASISAWQAFIGGSVMAFGARLGGGCTSGHGLSGLSALSFSSLVTVAAMFGAGILTRSVINVFAC